MPRVIIIGSGLVGSAMAVALARGGFEIDLIEKHSRRGQLAAHFDGRTSAIAAASVKVLESIGVWQRLKESCAITDIRVCDHGGKFYVHYNCKEAGGEPFGYMVENRLLRAALIDAVDEESRIQLYEPATVRTFEADEAHIEALLDNDTRLRAPLLLAADGKFSHSRAMASIEHHISEYNQTAMVATIAHSKPHDGLAVEAFFPAGPFALLPMTNQRSNVVWTERSAMAQHMLSLDDATFLSEISRRAGDHLGELSLCGPRHAYPLMLIEAETLVANRFALVGDAGHGIHPIAGQGVNLGYRDVAALTELLVEQARLGDDIGDAGLLNQYNRRRKPDIGSMCFATDALNRLFSSPNPMLARARDLGLGAVERMPALKGYFMRHAMGLGGDIPRMMRGEMP